MLSWLRSRRQAPPRLEEQLRALRGLGITYELDEEEVAEVLLGQFERELYEEEPYDLLLPMLGTDLVDEDGDVLRLSPEVWSFDTECIFDEDAYTRLLRNMVELSKGKFALRGIESKVDFEREEAFVSFVHEGEAHRWTVAFEDDWVDFDLLRKLGKLAAASASSKRYVYWNDGQSVTMLYCDNDTLKRLNKLVKKPFAVLG
ncbi:hypothetical protein SD70_24075 [Gordoniibacillus kamchatkensis]|uniref:Uncharacterized protein n=1 Tax=Gordoniibacillus kamchatkensis TaxID=1590651 RepID=A0ABR5AEE5_9BACL|nr:hypothetical protein [Paenibacillus sp. VKM B-2647]KIL38772.1 hypothetical protein SD70_24075 [Paenibacillus sp. VKM B-2647]